MEVYLRGLLEAAPDASVLTTHSGRISLVNRQTEMLFGYRREELIGQSIETLIPERFHSAHIRDRARYARAPRVRHMGQGLQLMGRRRDGSEFPAEVSLNFFQAPEGYHILSSIRDVSELRATERALRDSERFARSTFDALTEHICVLDEQGKVATTNDAWKTFAAANEGRPERVGEGENYLAVCDTLTGPEAPAFRVFAAGIRAMLRGTQDYCATEYTCDTPFGRRWFVARATRFPEEARIVVAHENVTELKQTEQALRVAKEAEEAARRQAEDAERQIEERRKQAERRQHVAETLRDVLATLNSAHSLDDVLQFIVSQSRRLLGGQAAALYRRERDSGELEMQVGEGLMLDTAMDPPSHQPDGDPVVASASDAGAKTREPLPEAVIQERNAAPDAPEVPVPKPFRSVLAVPVAGTEEDYGSLAIYRRGWRQFTPEETSLAALFGDQAALAVENAHLRDKAKEAAVLAERDRIARDLHDAVTQTIFSASLIADSLPMVWEHSPEEGRRGLDELRQLTHSALAEMRTLLFELRPAALLEKKLGDLVTQLAAVLGSRTRASIDVVAHDEGSLPPDVHVALFRIIQEALNNVAKHADARHVLVRVHSRAGRAVLRVLDDGRGFDTAALPAGQLGIGIMRERARNIGARLSVRSRPGRGTLVAVIWDERGRGQFNG
ncbi:MAG: PAS domain S-box protein [Nitrososphaerota archaeon]